MKYIDPKTVDKRILEFLKDAHNQIVKQGDSMPRMLFTAMKYRLSWMHMGCAVRLGIIKRGGWHWYWTHRGAPTMKDAEKLHDLHLKLQGENRESREARRRRNGQLTVTRTFYRQRRPATVTLHR